MAMGNQQVSLVVERAFVDKLMATSTPHKVTGYQRRTISGRGRWYVYIKCGRCGAESSMRWEAFKQSTMCDSCSRTEKNLIDGRTRERLYSVWNGMWGRCTNRNHTKYPRYGGRGIKVCPEWADYTVFRKWAVAEGLLIKQVAKEYKDYLAIDRIDPLKGYSPDNCRVLTVSENSKATKGTRTRKLQRLSREGVQPK